MVSKKETYLLEGNLINFHIGFEIYGETEKLKAFQLITSLILL